MCSAVFHFSNIVLYYKICVFILLDFSVVQDPFTVLYCTIIPFLVKMKNEQMLGYQYKFFFFEEITNSNSAK